MDAILLLSNLDLLHDAVTAANPPNKQPAAIKLVMEQMESMAPRFAEARAG